MIKILVLNFIFLFLIYGNSQTFSIKGKINDLSEKSKIEDLKLIILDQDFKAIIYNNRIFIFTDIPKGTYNIVLLENEKIVDRKNVILTNKDIEIDFNIAEISTELEEVHIKDSRQSDFGKLHLRSIEGVSINESKKSEVIMLDKINANLAIDNAREAFAKIPGLNVWESDESGVQLGIGSRGLSPKRSSNFNVRQNGYDISADAIGYPESYYTPPLEAVEKIEILRGAASLQYGTQFGGMVNFVMKNHQNSTKPVELKTNHSYGSYGFYKGSIWAGAKYKKLSATAFYQYRRGNAWRQNSDFQVHTSYFNINQKINDKLEIGFDYSFRHNLSQQPGGVNDYWFEQKPDTSFRSRNWFRVIWNVAALYGNYNFSEKTKLTTKIFFNYSYRESLGNLERISRPDLSENRTIIYDHFVNIGAEVRLLHKYKILNRSSAIATGMRLYRGFTDSKQGDGTNQSDADFKFLNPDNPERFAFSYKNYNASLFAENLIYLTDKWSITPGVRYEFIETNSNGYYRFMIKNLAGNIIADNRFLESQSLPRGFLLAGVGTSYRPNLHLEFYGNISQNYRAVTFSDMRVQNPNFKIDPNIQDEKGFTSDIGFRGTFKKILNYDFSLFYLNYSNRIGEIYKTDDASNFFIPYVFRTNIADANTYGFEFFGEINWLLVFNKNYDGNHKLTTFSTASVNQAKYTNTNRTDILGKMVENTPIFSNRSGLTYAFKNWTSTFTFTYIGEQFSDATNAESDFSKLSNGLFGLISAYHVADFSTKYTFNKLFFEASINNFTNQIYFTRRAESYPGPGIMPSPPIRLFVSVGIKI